MNLSRKLRNRLDACCPARRLVRELVDSLESDEDGWVHRGGDIKGTLVVEFVQDGATVAFSIRVIHALGSCWLPRRCESAELYVEGSRVPLRCCGRRKLLRAVRRWIIRYANETAKRVLA